MLGSRNGGCALNELLYGLKPLYASQDSVRDLRGDISLAKSLGTKEDRGVTSSSVIATHAQHTFAHSGQDSATLQLCWPR